MTNEDCENVAEKAWNLANEPGTNFSASVALKDCVFTIKELQSRIEELEKDARRWRAATRDMEINDIAVYCIDKYGYDRIVVGDEADAAIDTAMQKD